MSEINEIRNNNLAAIIGNEKVAVFARRCGLTDQQAEYLRQVRRGVRQMGDGFARTLEKALQIDQGCLDSDEPDPDLMNNSFIRKVAKEVAARDVPLSMQQTVLYMLRTAPVKATPDGTASRSD